MATTWPSDHSAIYCDLQLRLDIANDLSLAIGLTRIGRKVILMQLEYQSNSYNLMHRVQGWWFDAPVLALLRLGLGINFFGWVDLSFHFRLFVSGV
jgi:hypothetical protein